MRAAVFRADAGVAIGAGHVMRCLTLADELFDRGWQCSFVCSEESLLTVPNLNESKHKIISLDESQFGSSQTVKENWPNGIDLLVIDHYQLNASYESEFRYWAKCIFVIDDLATRRHEADLLLDQTLGRKKHHYKDLIGDSCRLLLGTEYSILRPEFAYARPEILHHRSSRTVSNKVLIGLGATDPDNMTGKVLDVIKESKLTFQIDIILGASAPHSKEVSNKLGNMPNECNLHINPDTTKIIEMMHADIAIGAAGTTSWERCCLGLPAVLLILAENQRDNAEALKASGAAIIINEKEIGTNRLLTEIEAILMKPDKKLEMSKSAALLCDGLGVKRIADEIINY